MAQPDLPKSIMGRIGGAQISKFATATLVTVDEPKRTLTFHFNPAQIKFSKTSHWNSVSDKEGGGGRGRKSESKRNVPTSEFQGGAAQTLSMDLVFDTTSRGKDEPQDVRIYTDFLVSLTLINPKVLGLSKRPPLVQFMWGEFTKEPIDVPAALDFVKGLLDTAIQKPVSTRNITSFKAYVDKVDINFTMFLPSGRPVRAEVQLTLTAQTDETVMPFQNPTSRSEAREMVVVGAGETLDYIAYRQYGDPTQWRHIAQTNQLLNPRALKPGQVLKITPLPGT